MKSLRCTIPLLFLATFCAAGAAPLKIGVLLKSKSGYWTEMENGAHDAGNALGAEIVSKAPPTEADVALQIRYFELMVANGMQAIVLAPSDSNHLAWPVAQAVAKGIKIVVVDGRLPGNLADVSVSFDGEAAGRKAAEQLAQGLTDKDEVSLLRHNQFNAATLEREAASIAALKAEHPGIVVHADVFAGTEHGAELEKAEYLLTRYPKTTAILASTTNAAQAVLKFLQARELSGKIKLSGYGYDIPPDIADAIDRGELQGWILQMPRAVGYKSVECAVALLRGEQQPKTVRTPYLLVTKGNLHDPKLSVYIGTGPIAARSN